MANVTETQLSALRSIAEGPAVYVTNRGKTNVKGLTAQTVNALRQKGLLTVNGASRVSLKGFSARRAVLTRQGAEALR